MKTSFWGKSLDVTPLGYQHVLFKSTQEHFVIERNSSSVQNLIFGEMYIEHYGTMHVRNIANGERCEIEFKRQGWSGKNKNVVEGHLLDSKGKKMYKVSGKWNQQLTAQNLQTKEEFQIWQMNPLPEDYESIYKFTNFTLQLNFMKPGLREKLPPTDSRLRTDQRALEEGDLTLAASEKIRLEEKQRAMRKEREERGIEH